MYTTTVQSFLSIGLYVKEELHSQEIWTNRLTRQLVGQGDSYKSSQNCVCFVLVYDENRYVGCFYKQILS